MNGLPPSPPAVRPSLTEEAVGFCHRSGLLPWRWGVRRVPALEQRVQTGGLGRCYPVTPVAPKQHPLHTGVGRD